MEEIRQTLAPLTDAIPPEVRAYLPIEAWWLVELVAVLAALAVTGYLLRAIWRGLFHRRRGADWDDELREDLDACPKPNGLPSASVYHVSVYLRLIVVAPGGKGSVVDAALMSRLLELAVPGLGTLAARDRPRIVIWPAQLSAMGFTNSFHRCTPTGQREDEPSQWVLLAGRAQGGGLTLFLGLALWSEDPTTLGRRNLEPHQWLDVLRLKSNPSPQPPPRSGEGEQEA